MAKVTKAFTFDTEADRDLLRWLERQKNASAAVRTALREHLGGGGVTLGDVYQAVRDLERKLRAGVVVADSGEGENDEPADVAAALDALAKL